MMASDSFIAQLREHYLEPVFRFDYDGSDMSAYIQNIGEIRRDINLMPGYCTVTVDNIDGTWDVFITNHAELTKKGVITFGLGGFVDVTYYGTPLSFHNNGSDPDTIEDLSESFISSGYKAGMVFAITGSVSNDGTYTIKSVIHETGKDVITLIATDTLINETQSTTVNFKTEELTLFTGYVIDSNYDYDTRSMSLTMQDRLSLALENKLQSISAGQVYPVWTNYYDATGLVKQDEHVVSDIVWIILTDYAGLDDTASTANTDIDYTSWSAWAAVVDAGGYAIFDIGVVANGETCSDILMKIARLTESIFWCGGSGKIKFTQGRAAGGYRLYSDEILGVPDIKVSMEDRINSITCKWAYMPDDDTWLSDTSGVVQDSDAVGPTDVPYTYNVDIIKDRVVFHNTTVSANAYMALRLARTAAPPRYFTVPTQLLGFIEDIANGIALQDLFDSPYDDIGIQINEIVLMPEILETRIVGQFIWDAGEFPA